MPSTLRFSAVSIPSVKVFTDVPANVTTGASFTAAIATSTFTLVPETRDSTVSVVVLYDLRSANADDVENSITGAFLMLAPVGILFSTANTVNRGGVVSPAVLAFASGTNLI